MEGRKEGIMEGRKEGIMEGRKEGIIATALKMLKDGMTIENVCKYTGLSQQQIEKLPQPPKGGFGE